MGAFIGRCFLREGLAAGNTQTEGRSRKSRGREPNGRPSREAVAHDASSEASPMQPVHHFPVFRSIKMLASSIRARMFGCKPSESNCKTIHVTASEASGDELQLPLVERPKNEVDYNFCDLRLQCIKLFQVEQLLTVAEAATQLGQTLSLMEALFLELRAAQIIELGGTRKVGNRIKPLFRLNPRHPGLECALAPGPFGLCSPEGYFDAHAT